MENEERKRGDLEVSLWDEVLGRGDSCFGKLVRFSASNEAFVSSAFWSGLVFADLYRQQIMNYVSCLV